MTDFGNYYDGLLTIVSMYRSKKETVFPMLKKGDVVVTILDSIYSYLVSRNQILPIETLPTAEKKKLWRESVVKGTKEKRQAYCRAHYLLSII